jgi:preprotein translocase subunit YajC
VGVFAAADVAAGSGSGSGFGIVIWILLIGGVIAFMLSSRRRQRAAQQQRQVGLEPGSHVITTAGLHGTVVDTDGGDVLLEVAPDVVLRFTRAAIARVVPPEEAPGATFGDHEHGDGESHDAIHDAAMGKFAEIETPEHTTPESHNGAGHDHDHGAGHEHEHDDDRADDNDDGADGASSGGSSAPKKL